MSHFDALQAPLLLDLKDTHDESSKRVMCIILCTACFELFRYSSGNELLAVRFLVDGRSFPAKRKMEKGTSPVTKAVRDFAVEDRCETHKEMINTPIPNPSATTMGFRL